MSEITFFTPSYRGDAERFALLRDSINHFYQGNARHTVIVPRSDMDIFLELCKKDDHVEVLTQEDYVDPVYYAKPFYKYIERFFPNQTWRFKKQAGRPGWIIQQIVKFSIPAIVNSGSVITLDSDMFFIRPFSDSDFKVDVSPYTLYKVHPESESAKHREHMQWARDFLGLESGSTEHHYISWPGILHPELIIRLQDCIENKYHKPWQLVLFDQPRISEYILYGVFVEEICKLQKVNITSPPANYGVWDIESFNTLLDDLPKHINDKLLVIIQSNLDIASSTYEHQIRSTVLKKPLLP